MRYLAIDLGDKRTGLAVGDDVTGIATPLDVIVTASSDERQRLLLRAIEDQAPDALVIGLPLNIDGSEGPAAGKSRTFAEALSARCSLPVHFVDERLTSVAADDQMARTGLTHKRKKNRRDALAAATILRDFLHKRS